jgi:hypothetical protein
MTAAALLTAQEPVVRLTTQARVIAVLLALGFLVVVLEFIRSHRLQERHSVIWFLLALGMLIGAAFPKSLELLARTIGVRDTNVALFSLILLVLLGLCFYFTVLLSRQSEQITRLAQETAIARAERDEALAKATEARAAPGRR